MLSDAEVERVCFRTAEILAPDTALPPTIIQSVSPFGPASVSLSLCNPYSGAASSHHKHEGHACAHLLS